ncbi:IclR family transcriptional regulator [Paraburkholderia sp. BCC1886]|uniref:IclR family transcriptional regulator n=1 Tax=Paraburkholderia sp. BCC1886 TaxID=2562670 RepID=UPI001184041D|nr:IclR family transcriptional regulator [Paraburkholderia sp. BCC1886]
MEKETGGIQVIARAAAILRALGREGSSLGTLAKETGLPRSTVQRIVDALALEHFVEAGEDGVRLGWGIARLAQLAQSDILATARPHMEWLFETTRETIDITCRAGREVSFLDRIISDQELRVVPIMDKPRPLYAMAAGKVILAGMSDAQLRQLLGADLAPLTPNTIRSIDALRIDLQSVHQQGVAFDYEEHGLGVCAVAALIQVDGLTPHALSIAVPKMRFEENLASLQTALLEATQRIVADLIAKTKEPL